MNTSAFINVRSFHEVLHDLHVLSPQAFRTYFLLFPQPFLCISNILCVPNTYNMSQPCAYIFSNLVMCMQLMIIYLLTIAVSVDARARAYKSVCMYYYIHTHVLMDECKLIPTHNTVQQYSLKASVKNQICQNRNMYYAYTLCYQIHRDRYFGN